MKLKIAKELSLPPEAMTLTSAVLDIRGSGSKRKKKRLDPQWIEPLLVFSD